MYLDSAIIVKLLVREPESDWFVRNLSGHSFDSSELALSEVCAALLFKERAGDITPRERAAAMEKFQFMLEDEALLLLPLNRRVIERARAIQLTCHPQVPLRTLDALHVATCDLHHDGKMSATDGRIRSACKQLGIALTPERIEELPKPK
jgi:predicted nucleic acid-binding protein